MLQKSQRWQGGLRVTLACLLPLVLTNCGTSGQLLATGSAEGKPVVRLTSSCIYKPAADPEIRDVSERIMLNEHVAANDSNKRRVLASAACQRKQINALARHDDR